MILQALTAYYETLAEFGKVTRPGWSIAKVSGRLTLSKNGEIEGFVPMKKEEIRGNSGYPNRKAGPRVFHLIFSAITRRICWVLMKRESQSDPKNAFLLPEKNIWKY